VVVEEEGGSGAVGIVVVVIEQTCKEKTVKSFYCCI
jgi:hypothetical protein